MKSHSYIRDLFRQPCNFANHENEKFFLFPNIFHDIIRLLKIPTHFHCQCRYLGHMGDKLNLEVIHNTYQCEILVTTMLQVSRTYGGQVEFGNTKGYFVAGI